MLDVVEEAITSLVLKQQSKLLAALPCKITQVHDSGNTAKVDVQPLVNVLYKDDTDQPRSQILQVPVVFPASKTSMVSFPVGVGDIVLCVFSSRNIDRFKSGNGEAETPTDNRRMSAQDAIAIPGLFPFASNPVNPGLRKYPHSTDDMVISHNLGSGTEVEIRLSPSGKLTINTEVEGVEINSKTATVNATEKISLNAPDMDVNVARTNWTGNITLSGNVQHTGNYTMQGQARFNGILFDTHIHGNVMSGPSNTGPVTG